MPLRRRASLLSASDAPRRVCHETLYNTLPSVERPTLASHTSHIRGCRAVHTTALRSIPLTSPTSACRWKRGRPVTRSDNFPRRIHQTHTAGAQALVGQPISRETVLMAGDHRRIRQASATLHRVGLWNPAHGLRFATTATAKAPKPDSIPEATETAPSRIDQSVATTRTDDPSSSTQDEASDATEHTGEAAVERASVRCDASGVSSQSETESKDADEDDTDGYVSLTYQIPEEKLRAAMLATPNTRDSYWSAKLYQGPDGEPLSTHYCKSFDVAERVAKYFLQEKVVGFDIEWKPRGNPHAIKQNASLIQLACEDRIALFHVSLFSGNKVEQLMPPSLKAVLESPDIYKVGVAVKGDFTRLEKYLNIQPQGVFELSRLHNLVEWYEVERSKVSNRLVSLTSQVLQHLQLPLYKGEQLADDPKTTSSVRESDWTLPLDMHQIHYAAADAYAGFRLYHMLEWKRTRMKPTPPPVALCDFDNKPTPRSKELPHKRAKKSKDVADTVVKSAVDVAEERQEDEGDAEGYETATEELTDSHQLEEPPYAASESACTDEANQAYACQPTPHSDLEKTENLGAESRVAPKKRIGRVKLSRLNNTDPGYPKLPKISQEEDAGTLSPALSRDDVNMRLEDQDKNVSFQKQESDDDEYADPELEDALGHMTLDDSGSLTEDANNVASEHTNSPPVANHNEASYLNPTSLHLHESHEPITASQSDIGLLEEPSRKPEYNLATTWAHEHLRLTIPSPSSAIPSRIRATVTHLRAYHMWYHQKLPVEKMTHVLRDPPLSSNTVANYILQAVTLERLEYERDSLKDVLLALPSGMRQGRWRALANEVDALK